MQHVAFFVNDEDYLLGIAGKLGPVSRGEELGRHTRTNRRYMRARVRWGADLTGELMRKAIGAINAGEVEEAHTIRGFIQAIYEGTPFPSSSRRSMSAS